MKRKAGKSKSWKKIRRSFKKIAVSFFVVAFCASIVQMGGTNAGFLDEEKSEGNELIAGTLDARASSVGYFDVDGMVPGDEPDEDMTFANESSLDFKYEIEYQNAGGDAELCGALLLTAKRNGNVVYDGLPLKDFDLGSFGGTDFSIPAAGSDGWNFKLELPAGAGNNLEKKSCEFGFEMNSWQTNFSDGTQGFFDQELVGTHKVETGEWLAPGDVVINEVMWMGSYDSDGNKKDSDEWIELRNMTSQEINIGGWKIDNSSSEAGGTLTIPTGEKIPASGYFLIANYSKADSVMNVDPNWTTTKLSLNNSDNGNLILKTATDVAIDSGLGMPDWPVGCNDKSGVCAGLRQSMERNDIPGDGLNTASWHTCVSGAANDGIYWDTADGNNFGTPGAANLSPVVMNEIMFNPSVEDEEWAELYNIINEDIDVSGWYFENEKGEKTVISKDNADDGETIVSGESYLKINFEKEYLDDESDKLFLYNDMGTPDDESDDVREDAFEYKDSTKSAGDSFMRLPDGIGIWIDPEATPGEENKLGDEESDNFRMLAYGECFGEDGKIKKKNQKEICAPAFLKYIGLIEEYGDGKIDSKMEIKVLDLIVEKEKKELEDLLKETEEMIAGEDAENISEKDTPQEKETKENQPGADVELEVNDTEKENAEPESENVGEKLLGLVSGEIGINLTGKLKIPDEFEAETDQKMKKIELMGEESVIDELKDFEIDLAKIEIDKIGKIEITVGDLDLPDGVELVDAKKDDAVALINVIEKPKDDSKKDEKVEKEDAVLPIKDNEEIKKGENDGEKSEE